MQGLVMDQQARFLFVSDFPGSLVRVFNMDIQRPWPVRLLTITLALGCLSCGVCVPRPSIRGISPNSATAGGNSFLLSVNGNDLRRDSMVSWNGSFRVTSFIS